MYVSATRPPAAITSDRSWFGFGDLFVLAVPMLQFVQFKAVGTLYASDLLLLVAFPVVVARRSSRLLQKQVAIILLLGVAWLYSQVLTDVIRNSSPEDYLRGWSKIVLTITHFATIWGVMRDSTRRFVLYGIGTCIGSALSVILVPTKYSLAEPWKFGFAMPVTFGLIIAAGWLFRGRWKRLVLLVFLAMTALNFYLNFRSLGLMCFLAAVYSYFRMQNKRKRLGRKQTVLVVVGVCASVWVFQATYIQAVESGWLGKAAQNKYEHQMGEGGMLLGGRSEILGSAAAIVDSPIIGHGSWARDPKYAAIMRERREELGYKAQTESVSNEGLIPSHSHIFGAWVEAGIVGAIFWLWILKLTVSALMRASGEEFLLPVLAFNALNFCWNIVFSPYGAEERFMATYALVGVLLLQKLTKGVKDASVHGGFAC